jgi:basic amino acid/polyamine antiporter, APA family
VGWIWPRYDAPVVAIVLQGLAATAIAFSGLYEQILNYVVSVDFISFGMTAAALLVLRRRAAQPTAPHAWLFVAASAGIVASTVATYPANSAIGFLILLTGIPVYLYWRRRT